MSPYVAAVSGGARSLFRAPSASRTRAVRRMLATTAQAQQLVITRPDDWHLHVRDGGACADEPLSPFLTCLLRLAESRCSARLECDHRSWTDGLKSVVPHTAAVFKRAVIMPNLTPPVTSAEQAQSYKQRILAAVPAESSSFTPLMTCYLTDNTTPEDVAAAKESGVVAFKLYPAGATTNSDSGVTSFDKVLPALKAIVQQGMLLLVHGEVTDAEIDIFDREAVFITEKLIPILDKVPELKVVMEHITTRQAAEFVSSASSNVAASITPQHILLNRNSLFVGGLRPHNYCLPVLKREEHRAAVLEAAVSGNPRFFLGTDSAPHPVGAKESACGCAGIFSAPVALPLYAHAFEKAGALDKLEGFASFHGPDFYGLPRNTEKVTLERKTWIIPDSYKFGETEVRPMWAGLPVEWSVVA